MSATGGNPGQANHKTMSNLPDGASYTPQQLASILSPLPNVRAIALAGSTAAGVADESSDFDIYLYTDAQVPIEARRELAAQYTSYAEVGNTVWGEADEWVLKGSGQRVDLVYFDAEWMADQLDRVLVRYEASPGYSTAFWHTIRISQTLYDPHGWFAALHARAQAPYPEQLRRKIVALNYPILKQEITSYYQQISRALGRNDSISINHRVAAFLASVFDIIFAVNRVPHPGEKRIASYVDTLCPLIPPNFPAHVAKILKLSGETNTDLLGAIDALLDGLDRLLLTEGLITSTGG
jgi:hypothetical protein